MKGRQNSHVCRGLAAYGDEEHAGLGPAASTWTSREFSSSGRARSLSKPTLISIVAGIETNQGGGRGLWLEPARMSPREGSGTVAKSVRVPAVRPAAGPDEDKKEDAVPVPIANDRTALPSKIRENVRGRGHPRRPTACRPGGQSSSVAIAQGADPRAALRITTSQTAALDAISGQHQSWNCCTAWRYRRTAP